MHKTSFSALPTLNLYLKLTATANANLDQASYSEHLMTLPMSPLNISVRIPSPRSQARTCTSHSPAWLTVLPRSFGPYECAKNVPYHLFPFIIFNIPLSLFGFQQQHRTVFHERQKHKHETTNQVLVTGLDVTYLQWWKWMNINIWNSYIWTADKDRIMCRSLQWRCFNLSGWKEETWKNSGLKGNRTHDLCATDGNNNTLPIQRIQDVVIRH